VTLLAKVAKPDSWRYLRNLYLINNVKEMVFFSRFKVCTYLINPVFSCSRNVQVTYVDKTSQLNTIVFRNYNYWFLIHTWSDKACKAGYRAYAGYRCVPGICRVPLCTGHMPGTVVYRAYAGYRCVPGICRVLLCTGHMPGTVVYKAYAGYRCRPGICRVPLWTGHMPGTVVYRAYAIFAWKVT